MIGNFAVTVSAGECSTEAIAVGVKIYKIPLIVFLEEDLVGWRGLRDIDIHMQLIESAGILGQLLFEVVDCVLLCLPLAHERPQEGKR